ncbi:hypothetical protein [Streptomyces venezuelae]|uniref:hypothetical protein n=1 Tax=Streptomyces venezuelae TaxID=54571 RepID=UPI0033314725
MADGVPSNGRSAPAGPNLPLGTVKLAPHQVRPLGSNAVHAPFGRALPTAPLHEMFARARERRTADEE